MCNVKKNGSPWPQKRLACEQALSGGGGATEAKMEKELAPTSQEFEFHPQHGCGSPLFELSDFGQSARTRKRNKHVKHVKEGQISRIMQI